MGKLNYRREKARGERIDEGSEKKRRREKREKEYVMREEEKQ